MKNDKEKNKQVNEATEFDRSETVGDSALDQKSDHTKKTKPIDEDESVGGSAMKQQKKGK